MSEKIYCKDCRFYSDTLGTCHKFPPQPMFDSHNKSMGHPYVCDNDWCGMAERRDEAEPEITVSGKIEAGDAVCICKHGEFEELKAENKKLHDFIIENGKKFDKFRDEYWEMEDKNKHLRGLITEIRDFLIGGAIPGFIHLKQECIQSIYRIANEEDKKRRAGE